MVVPERDEDSASAEPEEFEAAIRELERIVDLLDRDDVELDEALRLFERGVTHLRTANRLLADARGKIEELIEDASGGLSSSELELPDSTGSATGGATEVGNEA